MVVLGQKYLSVGVCTKGPELGDIGRAVPSGVKLLRYLSLWCAALDCPLLYLWGKKVEENLQIQLFLPLRNATRGKMAH